MACLFSIMLVQPKVEGSRPRKMALASHFYINNAIALTIVVYVPPCAIILTASGHMQ